MCVLWWHYAKECVIFKSPLSLNLSRSSCILKQNPLAYRKTNKKTQYQHYAQKTLSTPPYHAKKRLHKTFRHYITFCRLLDCRYKSYHISKSRQSRSLRRPRKKSQIIQIFTFGTHILVPKWSHTRLKFDNHQMVTAGEIWWS